jgi:hypothetical protein
VVAVVVVVVVVLLMVVVAVGMVVVVVILVVVIVGVVVLVVVVVVVVVVAEVVRSPKDALQKIPYFLTPYSTVLLQKLTGFAANQKIPSILWNTKVYSSIHKYPPPLPITSQLDLVHTTHILPSENPS